MTDDRHAPTPVYAVSLKLPVFDSDDPEIWFVQAENQFRLKGITQSNTMAEHVIQVLPTATLRKMRTWLREHPGEKDYHELKSYLMKEFSFTPAERTRRILSLASKPLGDKKVSDVYNELESLFCLPSPDPAESKRLDIEREIILISLPDSVRTCLQTSEDLPLSELVSKADCLLEAHRAALASIGAPVNAVTSGQESDDSDAEVHFVKRASDQRSRTRELVRGLCPYHFKYGQHAKRCWPGCKNL